MPRSDGDSHDAAPTPLRILLVEDDRDFVRVFRMLLEFDGHEVAVAGDGPTALELLQLQKPDVALIDLGLPKMNGCELAREIRGDRENDGIFLAALTGYNSDEDSQRVRRAGFNRHLVKPVGAEQVRALLADVAARRDLPETAEVQVARAESTAACSGGKPSRAEVSSRVR